MVKPAVASSEWLRLGGLVLLGVGVGALWGLPGWGVSAGLLAFVVFHGLQWRRFATGAPDAAATALSSPWRDLAFDRQQRGEQYREALAELDHLQSRLEDLSAALPDAAVVVDRELRIEWFNDSARALLNLQPQDVGHSLASVARMPQLVQYLREGDFSLPLELGLLAGLPHPLNVQVSTSGEKAYLVAFRDLTQALRLYRLRQEFVANVSHEIRSPLTVVTGHLELMEDHPDQVPDPAVVRELSHQCLRMRRIVEDLLELSRLEASELDDQDLQDVSLEELAEEVCHEAQSLISEAQHQIHLEGESGIVVRGRADELHSALLNLVSNALRYSPDGGTVTISWKRRDQRVRLSVSDQGVGIPKEHIARLAERFYRVDKGRSRTTGGTGLGLAIVKHVLQRHGGRLQIESEPGVGSRFTCVLPVRQA